MSQISKSRQIIPYTRRRQDLEELTPDDENNFQDIVNTVRLKSKTQILRPDNQSEPLFERHFEPYPLLENLLFYYYRKFEFLPTSELLSHVIARLQFGLDRR